MPILVTNKGLGPNQAVVVKPTGISAIRNKQSGRLASRALQTSQTDRVKKEQERKFQRHLSLEGNTPNRSDWEIGEDMSDIFSTLGPEYDKKWMKSWKSLTDDQRLSLKNEHKLREYVDSIHDIRRVNENYGNIYVDDNKEWSIGTIQPMKIQDTIANKNDFLKRKAILRHKSMLNAGTD